MRIKRWNEDKTPLWLRGIFFRCFYESKLYFKYIRCCSRKKCLQNLRSLFLSIKIFTTVTSAITIFTINFNNDFAITHVRYFRFITWLSSENSFSQRSLLFVIVFHSSSTILPVNVFKIFASYFIVLKQTELKNLTKY